MTKRALFIFSMVIGLISCNSTSENKDENPSIKTSTPNKTITSNLTINKAGYEFMLVWPTDLTKQILQPEIKYNETSGVLEILGGNKIQIEVIDETMNLDEIKKELQDNQMFTYKFYEESAEGFIFQAVLPDGSTYFYNFLQQKTIGSKTYLFKNRDNEKFTLKDIKTMQKIAASAK